MLTTNRLKAKQQNCEESPGLVLVESWVWRSLFSPSLVQSAPENGETTFFYILEYNLRYKNGGFMLNMPLQKDFWNSLFTGIFTYKHLMSLQWMGPDREYCPDWFEMRNIITSQ